MARRSMNHLNSPATAAAPARWPAVVALLLFLACLAIQYPGRINADALTQLEQIGAGHYDDWHPPVMAALWAALLNVVPPGSQGVLPPILAQAIGTWIGLGLIASTLARIGRPRSAWVVLLCGLSPHLLRFMDTPWSDSQLTAALLMAFGLGFWGRYGQPPLARWWIGLGLAFLFYATLVRANAAFAYGAILLFLLRPKLTLARLTITSVVLALVAIPVSMGVNRVLFSPSPSGVERSLQLFDIMGTARQSGDYGIANRLTPRDPAYLRGCHTAYYWDHYASWGTCSPVWEDVTRAETASPGLVTRAWIDSMIGHPVAYLTHRLKYFNSMLYFIVPADPYRFADPDDVRRQSSEAQSPSMTWIAKDTLKRLPTLPILWLMVRATLLTLLAQGRLRSTFGGAEQALLVSGGLYVLAFLGVGVATDMRYHMWPITAAAIASIMLAPQLRALFVGGDRTLRLWIALIAGCAVIAVIARSFDNPALLF